jgi:hypothetical protein
MLIPTHIRYITHEASFARVETSLKPHLVFALYRHKVREVTF